MKQLLTIILLAAATAQGQQINAIKFNSTSTAGIYSYKPPQVSKPLITLYYDAKPLGILTTKDSVLTIYVSKDSIIKYLVKNIVQNAIVNHISDSSGTGEPVNAELTYLRAVNARLRAINDSLIYSSISLIEIAEKDSKTIHALIDISDSLHERTQYADKVFQSLRDNGHFYKRKMYYRAIKDFKKRYGCGSGMKPAHYKTLKECK